MGDCHEVHAAAEGSADRLFGELTADTAQASGVQHITHAVLADGEIGWLPRVDTLRGPPRLGAPAHGLGHVKEAAESCGVPVQSWRTWEDGGIPRDILRLAKRVSAVTGVNYYWQLDGEAVPMTAPIQYEGPARRATRGRSKAVDSALADARARRDSNPQPSDPYLAGHAGRLGAARGASPCVAPLRREVTAFR